MNFLIAIFVTYFCLMQVTLAFHSLPSNLTANPSQNVPKPNDCESCITVFLKLAQEFHATKLDVEPGQFISSGLEKECLKEKFQNPEISCLMILEEVNKLNSTQKNILANPTNFNGMFDVCKNAVQGCPKQLNLENLYLKGNGTEDRTIIGTLINGGLGILRRILSS